MKKLFYFTIFFHLFFLSPLFSMEPEKPPHKKIYSMACLPNNTIALASEKGCDLITNPLSPTSRIVKNVRKQPTYRLMTNRNKDKICLCGARDFETYNVNTQKKLKSHRIINSATFFVAFSPFDDALVSRVEDELFINGIMRCTLPHVGAHNHFSIDCHPNGQEILYPSSDSTLTCRNINGGPGRNYPQDLFIRKAFYSPNGYYIGIITETGNAIVYEPKHDRSTMFIKYRYCIHDSVFLPDHHSMALVNELGDIYFWNFTTDRIWPISTPAPFNAQEISSRKRIVISPNESEFAVLIENQCFMGNIPATFTTNKMLFLYWILKQHSQENNNFLLPEIIGLFIKSMVRLQKKPMLTLVSF
jgi:hypothetical protein